MLGFPLVQWRGFRFRSPSKPQSLVSPSITPRCPQNQSQSHRRPDKQPARQLLLLSRALGKRRGAGRSSFGRCRQTEQLLSICSAARACVSNCVFRTKAPLGAPLATNNLNKSCLLCDFLLWSVLAGVSPLVLRCPSVWQLPTCLGSWVRQFQAKSCHGLEGPLGFVARVPA